MKELLKPFGCENDQCYQRLLDFFAERKGQWVNKAAVGRQVFKYTQKNGVVKEFSPETNTRKARDLVEMKLLEVRHEHGQAWYRWPLLKGVPTTPGRVEPRFEIRNGVMTAIYD